MKNELKFSAEKKWEVKLEMLNSEECRSSFSAPYRLFVFNLSMLAKNTTLGWLMGNSNTYMAKNELQFH